ncbi:hypothetical protein S1OALGB6SA_1498 [Olavius algarvensis spirochete endosymbiont]|nr:hypothetical protein S1OALGB6SA_1498 [Olavius algarvensis spirochete endosymbiont]
MILMRLISLTAFISKDSALQRGGKHPRDFANITDITT